MQELQDMQIGVQQILQIYILLKMMMFIKVSFILHLVLILMITNSNLQSNKIGLMIKVMITLLQENFYKMVK
jgi:hypothetical protein